MSFTDNELKIYLAGDASQLLDRNIETALSSDPALERRLMALDSVADSVRDTLKILPSAARLETLLQTTKSPRAKSGSIWGVSLAASILAGIVLGWSGKDYVSINPPTWQMEVASYQALYTPRTIAHLDRDPVKLSSQFKRASAALGLGLPQEKLAKIEALTLSRAQVLGFQGQPLIQIVYQSETGTPIALCIIAKGTQTKENQIIYAQMQGLASATWANNAYEFFLIGGQDETHIQNWANRFKLVFL